MPKRATLLSDVASCAQLLDESGMPVVLPFDLTLPFARFVAINKVPRMKRFTVGRVFRRNAAGGQPRALLECDFDIVGPVSESPEQEAETISFFLEFLECFGLGAEFACTMIVNHHNLIEAVLRVCGVPAAKSAIARKMFVRGARFTAERIAAKVRQDFSLSEAAATLFAQAVMLRGPFLATLTRFRSLFSTDQRAVEVCKHLKRVHSYCLALGVTEEQLKLDLSLPINRTRFDGIVFTALLEKQRQIVAVGGRYDALLRGYARTNQSETSGAVGIGIALEKVVQCYLSVLKVAQVFFFFFSVCLCSKSGGFVLTIFDSLATRALPR